MEGFTSLLSASPMLCERVADAQVVWAPAKVNLFLEVLSRRPDGYHDLASLMVAVGLFDTLVLTDSASGDLRLSTTDPTLTVGPENLVYRAAALLRERTGCRRGASMRLIKRIPLAAGLAGGSSDAAAALTGLNRLWRLGLRREELARLGAELGSDVAFFFSGPAAWCTGRGEIVRPLALGRPLWFVVVKPPVGLSTAQVFRGVTVPAAPVSGDEACRAAGAGDVERLGRCLHNRLQPVAEAACPEVARLSGFLAGLRPAGSLMSGSGTSVFALCRDRTEAGRVAGAVAGPGRSVECGRSDPTPNDSARVVIVRSCV